MFEITGLHLVVLFGKTVKLVGDGHLLEEVCHWGVDRKVSNPVLLLVHSLCFWVVSKCDCWPHGPAAVPSPLTWTAFPWNIL